MIQTYMQTVKKGVWLDPIGISHSLDHVVTTMVLLCLFNFFIPIPALTIILLALAEGIIHYTIDYVKVRYGSKDLMKPRFWQQFGLDQLAHQICYLLIAAVLLI
jgi:hypothetical protein